MNGLLVGLLGFLTVLPISADTIILNDGSSYAGQFTGAASGMVTFTDGKGVQYRFPLSDVQSMVYTPSADIVTLRTGQVYSGHYTGSAPISFRDFNGVQYRFPLKDVASLVLARPSQAPPPSGPPANAKVIPEGTPISIRADETIDSARSTPGQLYAAMVTQDILDSEGRVAIMAGAQAKLLVRDITTGGVAHSPELVLDLFSVSEHGSEYRVVSSDVDVSNRRGVGANRRTAEYAAGGSGLGALLGAVIGGGKGAAIGAGAGGAGGLLTQIFTRGKAVKVPAESVMTFRLDRTLVLRPRR